MIAVYIAGAVVTVVAIYYLYRYAFNRGVDSIVSKLDKDSLKKLKEQLDRALM